jgi:hypothetical protein
MPSQPPTAAEFLDAKAEILQTAREATATDGIINNGHEMERELVSGNSFVNVLANYFQITVIEMGESAGFSGEAPEMAELWVISDLLAEDVDARIPEDRWREVMKTMDSAGNKAGEVLAAGATGGSENTTSAASTNILTSTAAATPIITSVETPNTPAAIHARDSRLEVLPYPGEYSETNIFQCLLTKFFYRN